MLSLGKNTLILDINYVHVLKNRSFLTENLTTQHSTDREENTSKLAENEVNLHCTYIARWWLVVQQKAKRNTMDDNIKRGLTQLWNFLP